MRFPEASRINVAYTTLGHDGSREESWFNAAWPPHEFQKRIGEDFRIFVVHPVLSRFARIPNDPSIKNKYYGVYNAILTDECFTEGIFFVEPQYALPVAQIGDVGAIDFVITFVVEVDDIPVPSLEIKPPTYLRLVSAKAEADSQMRSTFFHLYSLCRTPRLYGISAIGKRYSIYVMDTARDWRCRVRALPESRWDLDITTEKGYERFMAVVADVKQMVREFHDFPSPGRKVGQTKKSSDIDKDNVDVANVAYLHQVSPVIAIFLGPR
ncbi:hypothetical protein IW261DRAFT_1124725 [Armillaria novae-zelandiae]|uniref:Uncharacterized protein n=1 Tax=Armillaria novae-zelandiae TaxID=153914 RepID=A0AA39U2L6_9AGAR|nr:hypothetical protein IW261DRAFT_1124725 [Armillaria novae-zelandiae]